jgi:hypothetical protein
MDESQMAGSEKNSSSFLVTVAETETELIIGLEEIILNRHDSIIEISNVEDLFENNLLDDWFHAFCRSRAPYITVKQVTTRPSTSFQEEPNEPNAHPNEIEHISFSPTNPFHWYAFCGRLFLNVHNGILSSRREDASLQVMIFDSGNTLKELCKRQFNEFIQKEMMVLLLQLQTL